MPAGQGRNGQGAGSVTGGMRSTGSRDGGHLEAGFSWRSRAVHVALQGEPNPGDLHVIPIRLAVLRPAPRRRAPCPVRGRGLERRGAARRGRSLPSAAIRPRNRRQHLRRARRRRQLLPRRHRPRELDLGQLRVDVALHLDDRRPLAPAGLGSRRARQGHLSREPARSTGSRTWRCSTCAARRSKACCARRAPPGARRGAGRRAKRAATRPACVRSRCGPRSSSSRRSRARCTARTRRASCTGT
jgi:hypothetical protein